MNLKPIEDTFIWRLLEIIMRVILIVTSILLVIIIGISVYMRYVMDSVFFGSDELLALLAIWLYWVGGAYGSYEHSHISADMTGLFIKNEKVLNIVRTVVKGVTVVITGVFAYWSIFEYFVNNITSSAVTTALRIPYWCSRSALTVGLVLMFLYSVYHFVRALHPRKDGGETEKGEAAE